MVNPNSVREAMKFDYDWKFQLGDDLGASAPDYRDDAWRALNLPHDWAIEGPFGPDCVGAGANGFFPGGIGWYRKGFVAPSSWNGKRIAIQFDGVYHNSDVYVNGRHVGNRPYGYVSFQYDITDYLRHGEENVIAVRVDHSDAPTSRWYSGAGIYRHVWLTVTDPLHVAHWGTYITTPRVHKRSATVRIRTAVQNEGAKSAIVTLVSEVVDNAGAVVAIVDSTNAVPTGGTYEFDQRVEIAAPRLWSIETPSLYTVRTSVKVRTRTADTFETSFGVRSIRYDAQSGFSLNGKTVKMKGFCLHHDAGCLGAAVPVRAWERRLEIMKEFGCNAIRTSHNPPAPELLDLCDRMGFLVIDEAFDKWKIWGYYKEHFDAWWRRDLNAMLLRDRNHPSVVMWSVGNEVLEQGLREGTKIVRMLVDHVHKTDGTRPATYAAHPGRAKDCINNNGFADSYDVAGYNYQEQWYESDKQLAPDRIVLGTEVYPYYRGRADYGTKTKVHNVYTDFAPINPWYDVLIHDNVIGQFIWSGIDYLGESVGWPSKGWPNGLIDTAGFLKARSGFHRCAWNSAPQVHIGVLDDALDIDHGAPAWSWPNMVAHWNFPHYAGRVIRVETFTNCEKVELLLNGESLGVRLASDYPNSTILWHVPYTTGSLKAVGINKRKEVATEELRTAGVPATIALAPDRLTFTADAQDIVNIEADLLDEHGVRVPDADALIAFEVTGPGAVIGVDNGDLRSPEPYVGNQHTTRGGRLLAVLRSTHEPGDITVTAYTNGLPPVSIVLHSL